MQHDDWHRHGHPQGRLPAETSERAEDGLTEGTAATQTPPSGVHDSVAVRLPATSVYLSVLRTVTAGLAARLDFTLDEIEDLRIAVDEACGLLLAKPQPDGELECQFQLDEDTVHVHVSAPTVDGAEPARDSFAWNVLAALVGEVDSHVGAGNRVSIILRKRRGTTGVA